MKITKWLGCLLLGIVVLGWQVGAAGAADAYPITGFITLGDGRPVEGVAIYLDGELAARSDRSGQYMVPAAPGGDHLVQPVNEGMTFVPASTQVTLPPEAAGVNFTAFAASSGIDSTSTLIPAAVDETPLQALIRMGKRWLNVFQQLSLMMLVLSIGAFMALAARRLRSGEWSLDTIFRRRAVSADQEEPAGAEPKVAPTDWEMVEPNPQEPGVEAAFEVVSLAGAAEVRNIAGPAAAAAVHPEQPAAAVDVPAVPGKAAAAVQLEQPAAEVGEPAVPGKAAGSQHRRAPRIAVRPYPGSAREHAAASPRTEAEPAIPETELSGSQELLRLGINDVRNGNLSEGEARLRQVVQQDRDSADGWLWLGAARLRQGDVRTAERCFLQAQRLGHPHAAAALERTRRS